VKSGGLQLDDTSLQLKKGAVSAQHDFEALPTLSGHATSPYYVGNVLDLTAQRGSDGDYNFMRCTGNQTVQFQVLADGSVVTKGGVMTQGASLLHGDVTLGSRTMLGKSKIKAGDTIVIEPQSSFVEITDDGAVAANKLTLTTEGAEEGQVVIIKNSDAQSTTGGLVIPTGTTFMFVFDGEKWAELAVREAVMTNLSGVTKFEAADHLDIGDHSFTARTLVASGQTPGRVAFFGPGGVLAGSRDMVVDGEGVLQVKKITAQEVGGAIDFKGNKLRNAVIVGSVIEGSSSFTTKKLVIDGAPEGVLVSFGPKGTLTPVKDVKVDADGLQTTKLKADEVKSSSVTTEKLVGDIDGAFAQVTGMRIQGGSISSAESVETSLLKVSSWKEKEGALAMFSSTGDLVPFRGLTYDNDRGVARVERLDVGEIVDFAHLLPDENILDGRTLQNVTISGGRLEGITLLKVDNMEIKESATIDGEAFIQGSLTVSGTVMGSGPYVDSSDGRFKENIESINSPLETIARLQGVSQTQ